MENLNKNTVSISRNNYADFFDTLSEIQARDIWEEYLSEELSVGYMVPGDTPPYFFLADKSQIDDFTVHGGFYLTISDKTYIMHKIALDTLMDRAGIKSVLSASCLSNKEAEADISLLVNLINVGLSHFGKKNTKVLFRGGQVMAVHSNLYSAMSQADGLQLINERFSDMFSSPEFIKGTFEFDRTEIVYKVFDAADPLMEEYEKAWKKAGLSCSEFLKNSAYARIVTSDVGNYTFGITPFLTIGKTWVPLSKDLEVKHRGSNEIAMLNSCVDNCFTLASQTLKEDIPRLLGTILEYPQPALVRILEKQKITAGGSKQLARKLVSNFEAMYDTYSTVVNEYGVTVPSPDRDILCAFDLYCFVADMQYLPEFNKLNEITQIKLIEKIFSILKMDFADLDKDGPRNID